MPNASNMSAMTLATHGVSSVPPTILGAGGAVSGDYYHVLSARPPRDRTSFANTASSAPLGPSAQSVSRAKAKKTTTTKFRTTRQNEIDFRKRKSPPRKKVYMTLCVEQGSLKKNNWIFLYLFHYSIDARSSHRHHASYNYIVILTRNCRNVYWKESCFRFSQFQISQPLNARRWRRYVAWRGLRSHNSWCSSALTREECLLRFPTTKASGSMAASHVNRRHIWRSAVGWLFSEAENGVLIGATSESGRLLRSLLLFYYF